MSFREECLGAVRLVKSCLEVVLGWKFRSSLYYLSPKHCIDSQSCYS